MPTEFLHLANQDKSGYKLSILLEGNNVMALARTKFLAIGLVFIALTQSRVVFAKTEIVDTAEEEISEPSRAPASASESKKTHVGRDYARSYFERKPSSDDSGGGDRYLAIHLGSYTSSQAYQWSSQGRANNPGNLTTGVTYRVGEWVSSMDLLFRADFNTYTIDGDSPTKLSLLPMVTFPDARSKFPLYFGAGAGLGIFFKQVVNKSNLSLDYQLVAGARLLDVYKSLGFFVEAGMKNHLHLLTEGQFNGFFVALGTAFTF